MNWLLQVDQQTGSALRGEKRKARKLVKGELAGKASRSQAVSWALKAEKIQKDQALKRKGAAAKRGFLKHWSRQGYCGYVAPPRPVRRQAGGSSLWFAMTLDNGRRTAELRTTPSSLGFWSRDGLFSTVTFTLVRTDPRD